MSAERDYLSPLFSWRSAIAESNLPPMSRFVALTLSLHMNERGGSCFPTIETLAAETGLAAKTVSVHLATLSEAGYLSRDFDRGGRGRGTRVLYKATTPPTTTGGLTGGRDDHPPFDGTTTPPLTGGEESVIRASIKKTSDPVAEQFETWWKTYPTIRHELKAKCLKKWRTLSVKDRAAAVEAVVVWADFWKRAATDAEFIPLTTTWLSRERWNLKPPELKPTGDVILELEGGYRRNTATGSLWDPKRMIWTADREWLAAHKAGRR